MPSSKTQRSAGAFDGLTIKWGRVLVFVLGGVSLALAILTGLLAIFTAVTWPWPVFLALLGAGCLVSLRYLAVRDRVAASVGTVRSAEAVHSAETATVIDQERPLFDHEQLVARDSERREIRQRSDLDLPGDQQFLNDLVFDDEQPGREQQPAPAVAGHDALTQEELRAEARRVARRSVAAESADGSTWQPVPVPKPTYARAAVAHRESPAALSVPAVPAPTSQTLEQAARAPQAQPEPASQPEPQPGRIDLDDVLSRRRA